MRKVLQDAYEKCIAINPLFDYKIYEEFIIRSTPENLREMIQKMLIKYSDYCKYYNKEKNNNKEYLEFFDKKLREIVSKILQKGHAHCSEFDSSDYKIYEELIVKPLQEIIDKRIEMIKGYNSIKELLKLMLKVNNHDRPDIERLLHMMKRKNFDVVSEL